MTLPDGRREYRVYRPDLREALDDLWAGRATRLLCLDLDRAFRDPKDLQDLIDVVEHAPHDIVVESVTGSLHMERGYDNLDAEVRVLVANKSSVTLPGESRGRVCGRPATVSLGAVSVRSVSEWAFDDAMSTSSGWIGCAVRPS